MQEWRCLPVECATSECGSSFVASLGARYSFVGTTGAALLFAREVGRPNMGITLDVGHCLMAGENPAQSVAAQGHSRIDFSLL